MSVESQLRSLKANYMPQQQNKNDYTYQGVTLNEQKIKDTKREILREHISPGKARTSDLPIVYE